MIKFLIHFFLVLLSITLITGPTSCKKQEKIVDTITEFESVSPLIINYTKDEIETNGKVRIVFSKPMVDLTETNKIINNNLIKFYPKLEGELLWKSTSVLEFSPNKLKANTNYVAKLDLSKLTSETIEEPIFKFNFKTIPLSFDIHFDGLKITSNKMVYKGELEFNGQIEPEKVEQLLTLKSETLDPIISWEHKEKKHAFSIGNISKARTDQIIELIWNGSRIDIEVQGNRRILIPSKDDFYVINVKKVPHSNRKLIVQFSDLVQKNQNLDGLIKLKGDDSKSQFIINGNNVEIIFEKNLEGKKTIIVDKAVLSHNQLNLLENGAYNLSFSQIKPALKILGKGAIIPVNNKAVFSFAAINLNAVDVEISKVYKNNMLQFLQSYNINSNQIPSEVGEIIKQEKIVLSRINTSSNTNEWVNYGLDLNDIIALEPGSTYSVTIGFRHGYINYECVEDKTLLFESIGLEDFEKSSGDYKTIWKNWRYYNGSKWQHRNNPCYPLYYISDHFIKRTILASNVGMIAKYDNNSLFIALSNINTALPITNAEVSIYSYQQQLIKKTTSDKNGLVHLDDMDKAHFIVANSTDGFAYLKLNDGLALSNSEFDVNGKKGKKEIDGVIYGERGVWRPGDSMFLNFVLRDIKNTIPSNHPISLKLYTPKNKLYLTENRNHSIGNIYNFNIKTDPNAPTGNWKAVVTLGNHVFRKTIKVETVIPNRFKIAIDANNIINRDDNIGVQVNWLHGSPANNVKATVDIQLKNLSSPFKSYKSYQFQDPARKFSHENSKLFTGKLDENGFTKVPIKLNGNSYPGLLQANFLTRAYEEGGAFSMDVIKKKIAPYKQFVGIKFPTSRWGSNAIKTNKDYKIPMVLLDANGSPLKNKKLTIGLYSASWNWWWDSYDNEISNYNSSMHIGAYRKMTVVTNNEGKAVGDLIVKNRGPYLIRVCDDTENGHCTGVMFYAGSYGGGNSNGNDFAANLKFVKDKKEYNVGDKAKLSIPSGKGSRVLITLECEGKVLSSQWKESDSDVLDYAFDVNQSMLPNIYAHVMSIRPLSDNRKGFPVRQYGVLPIIVKDPETILELDVDAPEVIRPNESYHVSVENKADQSMSYTLAVVDEGLLDLTNFKTPDLHQHFYAKRALTLKTWDVYSDLSTGVDGSLDKIFSIGGDMNNNAPSVQKANRFKPIVSHLGPFEIEAGEQVKHKLFMENYAGAVRLMIVGASNNSYGKIEQSIKVKQDLMLLANAPRVLSPGEIVDVSSTLFVTNDIIKDVSSTIETNDHFEVVGVSKKINQFTRAGEQQVVFRLKVKEKLGVGQIYIRSKSGLFSTKQTIEINIENPNPYEKSTQSFTLSNQELKKINIEKIGMKGTNTASIELSQFPSINIENKLNYLMRYPYGCVEQTTSSVFPQLYIDRLTKLSDELSSRRNLNIIAGINRLSRFQISNGGFSYWPGNRSSNLWGSNYATHFLVLAQQEGFEVGSTLKNALKYLKSTARSYNQSNYYYDDVSQAYRLSILALAGNPEHGAMNQLRSKANLHYLARWYLAYAYAIIKENEIANSILSKGDNKIKDYYETGYTYGTALRDRSVLLLIYKKLGKQEKADNLAINIAKEFSSREWWSTQTTAYVLLALQDYAGKTNLKHTFDFEYIVNGKSDKLHSDDPFFTILLSEQELENNKIEIKNKSNSKLYLSVVSRGQPLQVINTEKTNSNIKMKIEYLDEANKKLDVSKLKQGTDFFARVTINEDSYGRNINELVLQQIFPSGWEILNSRMTGINKSKEKLDYQDFKDDRVYSFFDLGYKGNKTITIPLNAAYVGKYYLPETFAEAMYDDQIYAREPARWIEVVK